MGDMSKNWDLSAFYQGFDDPKYIEDIERLTNMVDEVDEWSKNLESTVQFQEETVVFYLESVREITELSEHLKLFAELSFTVDTANTAARSFMERLDLLTGRLSPVQARFSQWFSRYSFDATTSDNPIVAEHAFVLAEIKEQARYMLSAEEEQLLAQMKNTGSTAWSNLQGELTSTLQVELPDGTRLPLSAARAKAYEKDRAVRQDTYNSELAAYAKIEQPVAASLNAIKGEVLTVAKMRGYDSPLDMTLRQARMDKDILDAMLSAMREYLPKFREYYRAKAHAVSGNSALPFFDLFAPMGSASRTFTWDEARSFIVRQFGGFSKELAAFADNAFEKRWIDVLPKKGKIGGAFCAGAHKIGESRILTNFTGSYNDVRTVAHELGHGWHGWQLRHLSILNTDYPMTLAETASIFCETIVNDGALSELPEEEQLAVLEADVSSAGQVVVDIYSRYLFETEVFDKRRNGSLSVEQLKDAMIRAQKNAYGDGLDEQFLHPYMWICKPHYYSADYNFYNFPYAFGLLFAKGLYALYKERGDSFVPVYNELLQKTGSMKAADVAASVGIDLRDSGFWESSLSVIAADIDRLITLLV